MNAFRITYTDGTHYETNANGTAADFEKYLTQDGRTICAAEDPETGKETFKTIATVQHITENTYTGTGQFQGWKFTLTPSGEGYTRHTITAPRVWWESVRECAEFYDQLKPGYAKKRKYEIEHPADDWIEANWLTQWTKHGLIKPC